VSVHVAVIHYPEGAGHATRMMGVARELDRRGASVTLAGGGDGRRLYEPNDYTVYEPPRVNYVEEYQHAGSGVHGVARVLAGSVPDSARRVGAIRNWIKEENPDAVVTDDMFGAAAAATTDHPLYALSHDAGAMYDDPVVGSATRAVNAGVGHAAARFFCPAVWPPHGEDVPSAARVPPVALEPPADDTDDGPTDPGVVVVPSAYSVGFGTLAERLREAGHRVTLVGEEDWTVLPSLLPTLERAETVVCSGYSTVMEAAVAGTHCVVCPATNEQRGVARRLLDLDGFTIARDPEEVETTVAADRPDPEYTNGVRAVAARVLDDVETGAGATTSLPA
jgi:hypothetical protein